MQRLVIARMRRKRKRRRKSAWSSAPDGGIGLNCMYPVVVSLSVTCLSVNPPRSLTASSPRKSYWTSWVQVLQPCSRIRSRRCGTQPRKPRVFSEFLWISTCSITFLRASLICPPFLENSQMPLQNSLLKEEWNKKRAKFSRHEWKILSHCGISRQIFPRWQLILLVPTTRFRLVDGYIEV